MTKFRDISGLICCLASSLPLAAQETSGPDTANPPALTQPAAIDSSPAVASIDSAQAVASIDSSPPSPFDSSQAVSEIAESAASSRSMPRPLRFTTGQEDSFRTQEAQSVIYNRSWFRTEYSRLFWDRLFLQFDSKLNAYWGADHRAKAEGKSAVFEAITPEAFLQYSAPSGNTSVKLGVQRLIWGESQAGAITDEVSPRNYSELFFIPLEESRLGQFMVDVDHFSSIGNWTLFFVPQPRFNEYPRPGTAYYYDPFNGRADIRAESAKWPFEYGTRWKKTFGRSDISLMAASLMDNDYAYRLDRITSAGRLEMSRLEQRFNMAGVTFNYAKGKYLLTGEVAYKKPKDFNDANYQILQRDVLASSFGLTYSLGRSNTVAVEVVNNHVRDWSQSIVGTARDTTSLVLNMNLLFLADNLSVNWLSVYTRPFTSYQSSIRTSYKWSDSVTFSLDTHFIGVPNKISPLYPNRSEGQTVFRVQFQF